MNVDLIRTIDFGFTFTDSKKHCKKYCKKYRSTFILNVAKATTTTIWWLFVRDYPGKLVPERYLVKSIWIYRSKWHWVAVASAGPYANLHLASDNIKALKAKSTKSLQSIAIIFISVANSSDCWRVALYQYSKCTRYSYLLPRPSVGLSVWDLCVKS